MIVSEREAALCCNLGGTASKHFVPLLGLRCFFIFLGVVLVKNYFFIYGLYGWRIFNCFKCTNINMIGEIIDEFTVWKIRRTICT